MLNIYYVGVDGNELSMDVDCDGLHLHSSQFNANHLDVILTDQGDTVLNIIRLLGGMQHLILSMKAGSELAVTFNEYGKCATLLRNFEIAVRYVKPERRYPDIELKISSSGTSNFVMLDKVNLRRLIQVLEDYFRKPITAYAGIEQYSFLK